MGESRAAGRSPVLVQEAGGWDEGPRATEARSAPVPRLAPSPNRLAGRRCLAPFPTGARPPSPAAFLARGGVSLLELALPTLPPPSLPSSPHSRSLIRSRPLRLAP